MPGKPRVSDLAPVGHNPATDQTQNKKKWEKEVNKVAIKCWIRKNSKTRNYRQIMKGIWDRIGAFEANE